MSVCDLFLSCTSATDEPVNQSSNNDTEMSRTFEGSLTPLFSDLGNFTQLYSRDTPGSNNSSSGKELSNDGTSLSNQLATAVPTPAKPGLAETVSDQFPTSRTLLHLAIRSGNALTLRLLLRVLSIPIDTRIVLVAHLLNLRSYAIGLIWWQSF